MLDHVSSLQAILFSLALGPMIVIVGGIILLLRDALCRHDWQLADRQPSGWTARWECPRCGATRTRPLAKGRPR